MLLEIQRTVILFVLSYTYICAQDVTKVGGKIKVESLDPFAKPDVDPFASMGGSSGPQKQGTTIITKKETIKTVNTNSKPVVSGSDVRTRKVESTAGKNTQATNEKPYVETTSTERKTRVIGSGSSTLRESSNAKTKTETSKTQGTANVVNKGNDKSGSQSSSRRVQPSGRGQSNTGRVQTTGPRSQSNTGRVQTSGARHQANTGNTRSRTVSGQGNTGLPRQTGGNRSGGQNAIRTPSQTDRNLGGGALGGSQNMIETSRKIERAGQFGPFGAPNTGIYTNDGTMNIDTRGGNALSGMDADMGATEKPILYFRKLYQDRSICNKCNNTGSSDCYIEHPDDCRKYIRCTRSFRGGSMEPLEMDCAFGTFWSNEANTCDTASDVFCNKDPCMDTTLKSYTSGLNCRSYWRCVNGRSTAECCDNGQEYIDGHCVPSDSCRIDDGECPFKSQFLDSIPEKKSACNLEPIPGRGDSVYRVINHWAELPCADGTKFDVKTCGCISSIFYKARCSPTVEIAFDEGQINSAKGYVQADNVTVIDGKGSSYGLFKGISEINVPYFKNNENIKSNLVVSVRFFKGDDTGPESQVLASNCKTKNEWSLTPSFAIFLNKKNKQIVFFASTKKNDQYGATQHITLPYTPQKWTTATLKFLDEVLSGTVETLEDDKTPPKVQTEEKVLKGTLNTSIMPLMIGTCHMKDGFFGYIHQIKAYMCDPGQVQKT